MSSKLSSILLLTIAFIGGFVLMSMELVYPRVSVIWFGNVLSVWAIDLSMSLVAIAIGYWFGSLLLKKRREKSIFFLILIYLMTAVYLFVMNLVQHDILASISKLDVLSGTFFFSIVFMIPIMGLLAFSSPLLVHIKNSLHPEGKSGSSAIFGTSTLGGAISMLAIGLYLLPSQGITRTMFTLCSLLILNVILILTVALQYRKSQTRS